MTNYTLHLGDCLEYMSGMEPGSVDAIVTDLPYGNETEYGTYKDTRDNLSNLVSSFMPLALRVSKRLAITPGVPNMWLYPEPTWVLNWTDPSGEGGCQWGFPSWQPILVYGKDPFLQNGMGRRSDSIVKRFLRGESGEHPCPKPVGFMRWLIERTTMPGDLVADFFMGSGTTGVACMQLGRRFIGCEIDPRYFEIARRRIEAAAAQPLLIQPQAPKHEQAVLSMGGQ